MLRCKFVSALLLTLAPLLACGQSLATNSATPLSTRVVAYTIDAVVDTQHKSLDATETLTYRNLTGQPLTSFPFHLYLNAFQPDSTFTTETHFHGGIRDSESADEYPAEKRGSITLSHLDADGFGDLALQFQSPDDGNAHDRTVASVTLPHALAPGEIITFHLRFRDQFPESVARNGYKRDFLMGGQWFPKVGVFWHGQWNCHQYHATTEFFSDFGTYNVSLTLPGNYTVGATGVPTADHLNSNNTRTLSFHAEDVHDFAWAASPHFTVTNGTYLSALGPVQVRVLALSEHPNYGRRYLNALLGSMREFESRYGPYPYKVLTLIDPEPDSEMGGMEYPTLITGGGSWLTDGTHELEATAEHEFGHQYWYGMVATNEFEEAWLDEGINSYSEVEVMAALYGRNTSFLSLPWANFSDGAEQYLAYLAARDYDPVTRPAWQFHNSTSYGGVTYGKSAMVLETLANMVGQDTMNEAMRTYFQRFRFTHPTTEDFLRTIEEVAIQRGRATDSSLRPFFTQAVYGTQVLDYAVENIGRQRAQWWLPQSKDSVYTGTVTVHRIGDFIVPMTLEVRFADGSHVREQWTPGDGNDRWKTFAYARSAEIVSAELDPDHVQPLDVDQFNNSQTEQANPVPKRKITSVWTAGMQALSQLAGWLV